LASTEVAELGSAAATRARTGSISISSANAVAGASSRSHARISVLQRSENVREAGIAAHAAVVVAEEAVEEVAAGVEVGQTGHDVVPALDRIQARRVLGHELVLL